MFLKVLQKMNLTQMKYAQIQVAQNQFPLLISAASNAVKGSVRIARLERA